jgi:hypothetical protein
MVIVLVPYVRYNTLLSIRASLVSEESASVTIMQRVADNADDERTKPTDGSVIHGSFVVHLSQCTLNK